MNRSIFLKTKKTKFNVKKTTLNFGPQHPAAHGVLRLILSLKGEYIINTDTHIGLLHRGTEVLIEDKPYLQSIPYFDRLDYVSMLMQEHTYCLAIEKLYNKTQYSNNISNIRGLYDELTRILNHLLALACHALDVGSMSPIFWGFEEREKIMEFYERVSGARMHAAFYRPNKYNSNGLSLSLFHDIILFTKNCYNSINEINMLLIFNKLWKQRLVNIGIIHNNDVIKYNLSGVLARSTGKKIDIRLNPTTTYSNYFFFKKFYSFIGKKSDYYDRYIIRIFEMIESLNLINNFCLFFTKKQSYFLKKTKKQKMEYLINHFKYWVGNIFIKKSLIYSSIESAKGEFGVQLFSDNSSTPYRCKIKSPSYSNLQFLQKLALNHMLADLITLIGTIDIVFGEVDK